MPTKPLKVQKRDKNGDLVYKDDKPVMVTS